VDTSETIWHSYESQLRGFLRRRGIDATTIDDILQDVFLKIHVALPNVKDEQRLRSWVYQITRNVAVDYIRSTRPTEALPEWLPQPETDRVGLTLGALSDCLLRQIERLPVSYQQAIILSELQGMPQREVARVQGISLSGAKSRIQRGRERLRDLLLDCCRLSFDHRGQLYDYEPSPEAGVHGCEDCVFL